VFYSKTFISSISHSKKKLARYYRICTYVSTWNTRQSSWILTKLEHSRQIFKK